MAAIYGTTMQKTMELWVKEDRMENPLYPASRLAHAIVISLQEYGYMPSPEELKNLEDLCAKSVDPFLMLLMQAGQVHTQTRSEVELKGETTHLVFGSRVDFISLNQKEKTLQITDGKGSKYGAKYLDPYQILIYAFLLKQRTKGRLEIKNSGFLAFHPDVYKSYPVDVSDEKVAEAMDQITETIMSTLGMDHFPAKPDWITCRFCDHRATCPESRVPRVLSAEEVNLVSKSGANNDYSADL